jgi:NaMN:DMB phosphoribosyltransferase
MATPLCFATSRHDGLRRYEDYLVKEGVGAGGAAVAAALAAGVSCDDVAARVEELYERVMSHGDEP